MAIVSGPRQVGKTTLAQKLEIKNSLYLNWDELAHRNSILQGSDAVAELAKLQLLTEQKPLIIFDEIHKYKDWKQWLKGFYDRYGNDSSVLVTGSARMDVFRKGGDSLMGRYFNYRLHPLSVGELLNTTISSKEINHPVKLDNEPFEHLLKYGGFPEPYLKANSNFYNRWSRLREQQLLKEDIRELTRVQELGQLETLALLLKSQAGQLTSYSTLAKKVRVSVDTIRRWIKILESLYYCYSIRPWTKNITRSLLKEPKYYLWDWSQCTDKGARNENFIASHLLKAVHYWTDTGVGDYGLYFLRDKDKREVDFLVTKNQKPWFMVEVKSSNTDQLSPHLTLFKKQLNIEHTFQVSIDRDYIDQDIFAIKKPVIVPAKTLLSQLV